LLYTVTIDISLSNKSLSSALSTRQLAKLPSYALASSGTSEKHSMPAHLLKPLAKKRKPYFKEEDALIINPKPKNSIAIVTKN
jgi:hypothetical protein